jgi:hypothetical protein
MQKRHFLLIVILVAVLIVVVVAGWRPAGPNQFEATFRQGGTVSLDLSAGGYSIVGTSGNTVRVELASDESREVHCRIETNGSSAKVELEGPSNNFRATIYVPQRSDLNVDQTIGDLVVLNVVGNKNLGLGIGDMKIEVPSDSPLPNFDGGIVIGDLRANHWHIEKGGFFRSFRSSSSSPYSITAHVDIGDLMTFDPASHAQQAEDTGDNVPE